MDLGDVETEGIGEDGFGGLRWVHVHGEDGLPGSTLVGSSFERPCRLEPLNLPGVL